jgi:hypothetical protein
MRYAMKSIDIIPPHPTWEILDASKLTTYMACPRKYFFGYILGWEPTIPNNDLVFGSAWHVAMEHLLLNGYTSNVVDEACELFFHHYRKELGPETDENFAPKNPANAMIGIGRYAANFAIEEKNYKVMHTEVAGRVKIGDNAILAFRMDCIRRDRDNGLIEVLDHKSSGRKISGWNRLQWQSVQLLVYMHVLYSLWDYNKIKGGRIRCTWFYSKGRQEFDEELVEKSPVDMQSGLVDILTFYDYLMRDMYLFIDTCGDDEVAMPAFPRNPESCYKYGRICQFFDACNTWSNPLQHCEHVAEGYKQVYWNPLEDERIREEVDLT